MNLDWHQKSPRTNYFGFPQRMTMITRISLTLLAPMLADVTQVLVSAMRREFAIAMPPEHCILLRRNDGSSTAFSNLVVTVVVVVGSLRLTQSRPQSTPEGRSRLCPHERHWVLTTAAQISLSESKATLRSFC